MSEPDDNRFSDKMPSRPLRGFPPGEALVEITTRTIQGRFLLKPTKGARAAVLGVIGRALHKNPRVKLVAFWFLSNHYNLLVVTPSAKALSRFMSHLNGNIARELGREFGWDEKFWCRRYQALYVGLSDESQEDRLLYLLAQGTKEGLVSRPAAWPGANCLLALLRGVRLTGVWRDRRREYNANRRVKPGQKRKKFEIEYQIELVPLPCWKDLTPAERQEKVRWMIRDIERSAAKMRKGKKPLGLAKIMEKSPHYRPKTIARSPAPRSHGSRAERDSFNRFYFRFVRRFREASKLLREGNAKALLLFPRGCFLPPPPADAEICWRALPDDHAGPPAPEAVLSSESNIR